MIPQVHDDTRLSYPGERLDLIGQKVGPSLAGEYMWIVTADYDATADKTRCAVSYRPPYGFTIQEGTARAARCESEFAALGPEYRCTLAADGHNHHIDQHHNHWGADVVLA